MLGLGQGQGLVQGQAQAHGQGQGHRASGQDHPLTPSRKARWRILEKCTFIIDILCMLYYAFIVLAPGAAPAAV